MSQSFSEIYAEEDAEVKRLCNELDTASSKVFEIVDAAVEQAKQQQKSQVGEDFE